MSDAPETHRAILVRATGEHVVKMMEELFAIPADLRFNTLDYELKTVDGHRWLIGLDYEGFSEPKGLGHD